MTYIAVKNDTNLVRDAKTGAIINMNSNDYENYICTREKNEENKNKIDKIEKDLNNLKSDIIDIKFLLQNLLKNSF
jgi:tetrahydromethanopterin S-methyltransferase subunit B